MMKTKAQYTFIISVCAAVFYFLIMGNAFGQKESPQIKAIKQMESQQAAAPAPKLQRPAQQYRAENSRDPFRPLVRPEEVGPGEQMQIERQIRPLPSLTVQGLIWGGKFPQAIINDSVVKVGDTISEAKIINIDKTGVTVTFDGVVYNLPTPAASGAGQNK